MEHIFKTHWPILLEDPHLISTITEQPKMAYKTAPNIKNNVAPSKLKCSTDDPTQPLSFFLSLKGMYQCKKPKCMTCKHISHGQKQFQVKGKMYDIKGFFNCLPEFVVYYFTCLCGLFYFGHTIRTPRKRVDEQET